MADGFRGLLVEGVPGIGKSTILDALLRRRIDLAEPRRIRTTLHLAQTHTYGPLAPLEDARTLTVAANLEHLERIVATVEWIAECARDKPTPHAFVAIDTLHLTHCVRPGVVSWNDVVEVDSRLARTGCRLLLLTGSPSTLRARTLDARAGSQFLEYASARFGSGSALHAHFLDEQARLEDLFARSALRKLRLSNDGEPEPVVDAAWAWLMSSGT